MKVSAEGAAFIAAFEGGASSDGTFRPYRDPVGVWTIGYGHTEGVHAGSTPLTRTKAIALLRTDLDRKYGAAVDATLKKLGRRVSQKQFDALVSLAYNLGPGIVGPTFAVGQALRVTDRKSNPRRWRARVGDAFLLYDHAGGKRLAGLTRRREAERRLWMGGQYG